MSFPSRANSTANITVGANGYELYTPSANVFAVKDRNGDIVVPPNVTFSTVWNAFILLAKAAGGASLLWRGSTYIKSDLVELNVCSNLVVIMEPNVLFQQTANGGALTKVFRIESGASKISWFGNKARMQATVAKVEMFSNVDDCSYITISDIDLLGTKGSAPDDSEAIRFGQGAGDVISSIWIIGNKVSTWSKGIVTGDGSAPIDTLSDVWVLNNDVDDTSQEGIRANRIDFGAVIGNKVSNTGDNGIDIGLDNTHVMCCENHLYRCGGGASRGIHTDEGDHLIIADNELIECNDLMIQNSTNVLCTDNYLQAGGSFPAFTCGLISIASSTPDMQNVFIRDNQINCNDHASADGIQISDNVDNLVIVGNFIYGINAARTFCSGGVGIAGADKWVNNYCYTAAGAVVGKTFGGSVEQIANGATTVTFNHNLAITPDIVHVTGTHDEVARCRVTAITATQITVVASAVTTANRNIYCTYYALRGIM